MNIKCRIKSAIEFEENVKMHQKITMYCVVYKVHLATGVEWWILTRDTNLNEATKVFERMKKARPELEYTLVALESELTTELKTL